MPASPSLIAELLRIAAAGATPDVACAIGEIALRIAVEVEKEEAARGGGLMHEASTRSVSAATPPGLRTAPRRRKLRESLYLVH